MAAIKKFLFEYSFDKELEEEAEYETMTAYERAGMQAEPVEVEPEPEPEPVVPTFSEEELTAVREQAYAQGRDDGMNEARADREQATAHTLAALVAQFQLVAAGIAKGHDDSLAKAIEVALGVVRKLMPAMARRHGVDEVEALLGECLGELFDEPRMVVRVPPEMAEEIKERVSGLAAETGFRGDVTVLGDAAMGAEGCRIEWSNGGIERDPQRLWEDVEAIIARNITGSGAAAA